MIHIKKDPDRTEHLMKHITDDDYKSLSDSVDLNDLTEFIKELNGSSWVPSCYWSNKNKDIFERFHKGELYWAIYSYLIDKKLLIVEDKYYRYNTSRTDKYNNKSGYFNPLEQRLYLLVVDRLVKGTYLIEERIDDSRYYPSFYYTLGKSYNRENKLNEILI